MLERIAARQDGIIHRRQLLACEVSAKAIDYRVRAGKYQRVLPAVYALFSGKLTRKQELVAAHLYAGDAAQFTSFTALQWYGFRYARKDRRVHLLIPEAKRIQQVRFVAVHRTTRLDRQARKVGVLRICSPARSVADAARSSRSLRDVTALVAEAVQRKHATIAQLRRELERGPRKGSAYLRIAVNEIAGGARSAPEAELKQLLTRSAVLRAVRWNPDLVDTQGRRLPTPDAYLPEAMLALEVDSKAHHTSPEDWERTMRRHNVLGAHGIMVLHFSPARLRSEPQAVLAEIERVYLDRTMRKSRFWADTMNAGVRHPRGKMPDTSA